MCSSESLTNSDAEEIKNTEEHGKRKEEDWVGLGGDVANETKGTKTEKEEREGGRTKAVQTGCATTKEINRKEDVEGRMWGPKMSCVGAL